MGLWGMGSYGYGAILSGVGAALVKVAVSGEEAYGFVRQVAEEDGQAGMAGMYFALACVLCREGRWQEAAKLVGSTTPCLSDLTSWFHSFPCFLF